MSARLPLLVAAFVGVAAIALLAGLAPAASAAPATGATTSGGGCTAVVHLIVPPRVLTGAPFLVTTSVTPSASGGSCHLVVYQYVYFGFPTPTPNNAAFQTMALHPGSYTVGVLVRGSFGSAMAVTTFSAV